MQHSAELKELYNPVVANALKLTKQQFEAAAEEQLSAIQIIVLCGGLGSSKYIWNRFESH